MSAKRHGQGRRFRDPQLAREEALRPSRFLGYDRDQMGVYFFGREAFALAETQFRRAVWLNPYESRFRVHWALALIRLNRMDEARSVLADGLRQNPEDRLGRELWQRYWSDEPRPEPGGGEASDDAFSPRRKRSRPCES